MDDTNLLCNQVMENTLVLETIFDHLDLKDVYRFRHVCHFWKVSADVVIRNKIEVEIYAGSYFGDNWIEKLKSDLQYFASLKLCNLRFQWADETTENLIIAIHLQKVGNLTKVLKISDIYLNAEGDFTALEAILNSMPNLEKVELQIEEINAPRFLNFNPVFSCEVVRINLSSLKVEYANAEIIYIQTLKAFGEPVSNFEHQFVDIYFFSNLAERKKPLLTLKKIKLTGDSLGNITLLQTVNSANVPNLKKLFVDIKLLSESFASCLKMCLERFTQTLEIVSLPFPTHFGSNFGENNILLTVPPLPKLRKLTLGIPPIFHGTPHFLWNLGMQLAKDFPVLEELNLQMKRWDDTFDAEPSWEDYKYPEAWCIWGAIVPIVVEGSVDLSPWKTDRKVVFDLPPNWLFHSENIPWARSFLEVVYKLYPAVNEYYNRGIELLENLTGKPKSYIKRHE